MLPTDVRVREVQHAWTNVPYRTPLKFGGITTTHATLLDVRVRVETRGGRSAWGSGAMPLGHVWAFPSKCVAPACAAEAMIRLAGEIARRLSGFNATAHPIELLHRFEPEANRFAQEITQALSLAEPIPRLATLVCLSAFDAGVHD